MNDLIRSSVVRDDFQRWLDWNKGSMTVCKGEKDVAALVMLERNKSACYLYRAPIGKSGSTSWNEPMAFSGVYDTTGRVLYLTREALNLLADGSSPLVAEAGGSMRKEICGRINQRVEEDISGDRNNLPMKEITGEMPRRRIQYYQEHGARQDAIRMLFDGEAPDGKFHSDYDMDYLPEDAFLAYIGDPGSFVRTKAEEYVKANQERFLMQFLENDALLSEYQALMQDTDDPVHRMKAITDAINASGAKTVSVTIRKDGKELAFKAEAYSLTGHQTYYSTYHIQAQDRRKFKELFGRNADYNAKDVVKIAYGRKIIYEAEGAAS